MYSINSTLLGVKRLSGWVERSAASALVDRQERAFAAYGLWDGRSWRRGYGGPPYGRFRAARLAWWKDLCKTMGDRAVRRGRVESSAGDVACSHRRDA